MHFKGPNWIIIYSSNICQFNCGAVQSQVYFVIEAFRHHEKDKTSGVNSFIGFVAEGRHCASPSDRDNLIMPMKSGEETQNGIRACDPIIIMMIVQKYGRRRRVKKTQHPETRWTSFHIRNLSRVEGALRLL